MKPIHLVQISSLALTTLVIAGGCSSDKGDGGGSMSNLVCPTSGSCNQSEVDTWGTCISNACQTQYEACFGPNFKTGNYSGVCGTYYNCVAKCSCKDSACRTRCGLAPFGCQTCILNQVTPCVSSSSCKQPSCVDAGVSDGATTGGLPDASFGKATCADLAACCAREPNASYRQSCYTEYTYSVQLGDSFCSIVAPAFCM